MVKRFLALAALVLLVSSCGYRGALYLPEDAPENTAPADPDTPSSAIPESA
ncbi:LPS translocon maturation chaperone LptM [Alteromonas halophila]|uniref:LPS translocon maturation chaperone LptM n=1 Tax=Alteromonas halophila TaxID=516698 RepID=UPI0016792C7E|nr:lipoprotein [Alteromonas halophila]